MLKRIKNAFLVLIGRKQVEDAKKADEKIKKEGASKPIIIRTEDIEKSKENYNKGMKNGAKKGYVGGYDKGYEAGKSAQNKETLNKLNKVYISSGPLYIYYRYNNENEPWVENNITGRSIDEFNSDYKNKLSKILMLMDAMYDAIDDPKNIDSRIDEIKIKWKVLNSHIH